MRLARMRIKNYRCFDVQEINFGNYSCFVGPNGSGKSTVLMALNVFFRNTNAPSDVANLQEEDFHLRNTEDPIEITCFFDDLSNDAKLDLKAYVRHDELAVTARAVWDSSTSRAEVRQLGVRRVMNAFVKYFETEESGEKVAELKAIYNDLAAKYKELPGATTKDAMRNALREFEEARPDLCEEIESNSQFYGWSRGANLLGKYVQWVYLPAVKDATEEQDEQKNSALGNLLQRTIRSEVDFSESLESLRQKTNAEYRRIVEKRDSVLKDLQMQVEKQLKEWAHPGARVELNWHLDDRKSVTVAEPYARARVGEGEFLGEIVRSGHGMQRSFLVSLLQVLANLDERERPTLVLGFEEPELYQHPPQSKHLAALLEKLSARDTQVIITTHSPYFVSSKGYEDIRLVVAPCGTSGSTVNQLTYRKLCERLASALGEAPQQPTELMAAVEQIMQPSQSELFFCKVPILVEGAEDIAFITTFMRHTGSWDEFRRLGGHFVACNGKTNMSRPLAIAQGLGLRPFVIFDGDCDKATDNASDEHKRDNGCILELLGSDAEPVAAINVMAKDHVKWSTRILDEIRAEIGSSAWDAAETNARDKFKLQAGVRRKNPVLIAATVESLLNDGHEFELLKTLTDNLIAHCQSMVGGASQKDATL